MSVTSLKPSADHRRAAKGTPLLGSITRWLAPKRIAIIYALIALIIIFGSVRPDAFFSPTTFYLVINGAAISGIVAVALVIPLAAGVFDVSVGYVVALSGVLVAWLVAEFEMAAIPAILITLAVSLLLGGINALVVIVFKVESLIGTLATGLVFLSITTAVSNQQPITKNVPLISAVISKPIGNIGIPVIVLFTLVIIITIVMSGTAAGRRVYAVGFDLEAAKLAGLPTARIRTLALLISAFCASLAGVLLTARIGAGSPTAGPDYLLPAFAAVFVGATQITPGRFNAVGTLFAVYLIAIATVGLSILGAPPWAGQMLQGVLLVGAVAFAASGGFTKIRRKAKVQT